MTVVPLYNVLLLPETNLYFKNDQYTQATGKAPVVDEKLVLLMLREKQLREDMTDDSFYPIGVTGTIVEVNENGFLVIRTKNRVNLQEVTVYGDHTIELSMVKRPDVEDLSSEEERKRLDSIKRTMIDVSSGMQWGQMSRVYVNQLDSMNEVGGMMSPWMMNSNEERYTLLAEDSVAKRTEMLERMLYENLEMFRVNNEARSAQEEDYQKIYRESAIKKQIEYLQKELDAMHPENITDIRKFELKIEEIGMNETAKKEAKKVLNRLKQEGQNSAEAGMLYDYLDFVTGLSWKKEKAKTIDLTEAEKVLDEDHFGLAKVKDRIIQQIAVMNLKQQQSGSILLFVGAPGTGKTSIGRSIAQALHREYVRVSLGGVRDEADIRGHRRTYIGARPGRIMDGISKSGVSNPVVVLDEVDKLSASYNGDPASALLEVLDPEQNNTFTDHYMNVPYDLSDVLFICTANTTETIPEPLLNRMEVIQFQGYTPIEKLQIGRRHLLPKACKAVGIREENLEIGDDVIETIIADYTREGGVRGLKKRLDTLCRIAAVEFVKNGEQKVTVTKENLRDYLDMHAMRHGRVKASAGPGIVTGLAWTQVGGEILCIETLFTKGNGKLILTGKLGDVMKESAQIAVSLVKSLYPDKAYQFEDNDLHIHVPDGATPKDGPSAGITMTTALASLVTGVPVDPKVAMTGEISLQGHVGAIGGLPEKLMAAERAGATHVFIPADNVDGLRDVAEEVKQKLEITPVKEAMDVLKSLKLK
ncbi:MAG: endopeptidase La [Lachnospiraceae bacterium]|nr:endopeptidase La [Lachnospiraceae bacterium]